MKILFSLLIIFTSLTSRVSATEMPEGWVPFFWEDFTSSGYVFSHAAINLPAKLKNIDCYVQLDTGANYAFGLAREFKLGGKLVTVSLQVGSINRDVTIPEEAIKKINSLASCGRIGLVGNAFFETGTISINLHLAMFKFEHGSSLLNDSTSENFIYARKPGWEGGHIAVEVKLPSRSVEYAILDTGAAMFTFTPFDQVIWIDMKAKTRKKEQAALSLKLPALSNTITCELKNMSTEMVVGKYNLSGGLFGYCDAPAPKFALDTVGIVGMKEFLEGSLVLDYVAHKWKFIHQEVQLPEYPAR